MKYLIAAVLLCVAGLARADTPNNPDRMLSVGFDYTESRTDVTLNLQEFTDVSDNTSAFARPHSNLLARNYTVDIRAPISDWVTMSLHGGPSQLESFGEHNTGYTVGAGIRVYFQNMK